MQNKIQNLEYEKENQKNRFEEVQLTQKIKFDELQRKFKDLQKRSTECENIQDKRQYDFHSKVERNNKDKEEVENIQLYVL